MQRVVVGMSGGVDSSVAAYLLKEQGYEVIGLFMKNWHDDSVTISDECPWLEDSNDAMIVADKLGIPFQTIDLSKEYKEKIVDYMFAEYEQGRTPNPDVLCNREIKYDIFLKACLKLKADFVATGHYCQKESFEKDGKTIYRLIGGNDDNKDQSYFLCQLNQEQLSKALFPIGHLEKPEVRRIAAEADLITADKKDSQGLCFIGKVRLPDFLQQKLLPKKGKVYEILDKPNKEIPTDLDELVATPVFRKEDGILVGDHNGAHYYTIGQRKGLNIGGKPLPLFVLEKDVKTNIVYVGQGGEHFGLKRHGLKVEKDDIHWIREDLRMKDGEEREYMIQYRYRQTAFSAKLIQRGDDLYVIFSTPQFAVAAGQFVAWYEGKELIGSGVIA